MISATAFHQGRHLSDTELQAASEHCPLCCFHGTRDVVIELQAAPVVHLLSCPRCHACSASRMPTDAALQNYYSTYYGKSPDKTVTYDEPSRFARHLARIAGPFLRRDALSILDFGGGGGDLAFAVADLLWSEGTSDVSIAVVDYNSELVPPSDRFTVSTHKTLADVADRRFDLVVASAVLEHLVNPKVVFCGLVRAIRPGGVFYARTPFVAPLLQFLNRLRIQVDFTFPAHLHDLGEDFWESVPVLLAPDVEGLRLLYSRPSIVETSLARNFLRTVVSYSLKAPWYWLGRRYRLVGGWEVLIQREDLHRLR